MPFDLQDEGDFPQDRAFVPEDVVVLSPDPEASSTSSASPHGVTPDDEIVPPQPREAQSEGDQGDEPTVLPEFDPRFRELFEGLLYIGKLERDFRWAGHRFTVRTLLIDEILEIGLLHREYIGTISDVPAYRALMVAACLTSIDGILLPMALGPEESDLRERFKYVQRSYYQITIDAIYEEYLQLDADIAEVLAAMGKASGQSASIPG